MRSTMNERLRWLVEDERGFGLVEVMIAITILVIGLLAVSGLTLATAAQARVADLRSDQMAAGQEVIEAVRRQAFEDVESGVDTVSAGGRDLVVTRTVEAAGARAKQVTVEIVPKGSTTMERSFTTIIHRARSLPPSP